MPKVSRGKGIGCPPPQPTKGSGERRKLLQRGPGLPRQKTIFGLFQSLKKTHLIDTNLSFLIFLGDLAGRIETPGGPDCGPRAVCWTLLIQCITTHSSTHCSLLAPAVTNNYLPMCLFHLFCSTSSLNSSDFYKRDLHISCLFPGVSSSFCYIRH